MSRESQNRTLSLTILLLLTGADGARGQVNEGAAHPLGAVNFPVSCSEEVKVEFNRAIALLHHMTYPRQGKLSSR